MGGLLCGIYLIWAFNHATSVPVLECLTIPSTKDLFKCFLFPWPISVQKQKQKTTKQNKDKNSWHHPLLAGKNVWNWFHLEVEAISELSSKVSQPLGKYPLSIAHMLEHTKGKNPSREFACNYQVHWWIKMPCTTLCLFEFFSVILSQIEDFCGFSDCLRFLICFQSLSIWCSIVVPWLYLKLQAKNYDLGKGSEEMEQRWEKSSFVYN